MHRVPRVFIAALVAFTVIAPVQSAVAAPSAWQQVDVVLHTDQGQATLLVSGTLPENTKLPYEAELAVPAGTQLLWIGEILGGPPAEDTEVKYAKSSATGMDIYRFTLTKSRSAQVEGTVTNILGFDGTAYVSGLKWTAWQDLPQVRIGQRIPSAAKIVKAAPGASLTPGESGYGYYSKTVASPKAGQLLELPFSYTLPAAAGGTGGTVGGGTQGASGSNTGALLVVAAALILGLGFLFYKVNRSAVSKGGRATEAPAHAAAGTHPKSTSKAAASGTSGTEAPEGPSRPKSSAMPAVIALTVIGVLVAGAAIAGTKGTATQVVDGKIKRFFGSASPCQSTTIPYAVASGVDLADKGEELLDAFKGMEGVGTVAIDLAQSTILLEWCDSYQSEATMRQTVEKTGLVTLGVSPTPGVTPPAGSAPATGTAQ